MLFNKTNNTKINVMSRSRIISIAIYAITFALPFYFLYIVDEGVFAAKHIILFLLTLVGFFTAFAIGTNKPFDAKPQAVKNSTRNMSGSNEHSKAA